MMSIEPSFTNEAQILFDKFISELRTELRSSTLGVVEQQDTVRDVISQIYDLSHFKEAVVGTDTLKHTLNKIGTPREIVTTLEEEERFVEDVRRNEYTYEKPKANKFLSFTAKQVVKYYEFLRENHWKMLIVLIFFALIIEVMYGLLYAIVYGIYSLYLIAFILPIALLEQQKTLTKNNYLLLNIRPDIGFLFPSLLVWLFNFILVLMSFNFDFAFFIIVQFLIHTAVIPVYIYIFYNNRQEYLTY